MMSSSQPCGAGLSCYVACFPNGHTFVFLCSACQCQQVKHMMKGSGSYMNDSPSPLKPFPAEFAHVIWDRDPRATRSSYQISFAFLWTFVSELCLCNTCQAKIAVTCRHWKFCCVEISIFTCVGLRGNWAESTRTWMSSGLRVQTVTINLKLSPELRKEKKKTSFGNSDTSELNCGGITNMKAHVCLICPCVCLQEWRLLSRWAREPVLHLVCLVSRPPRQRTPAEVSFTG